MRSQHPAGDTSNPIRVGPSGSILNDSAKENVYNDAHLSASLSVIGTYYKACGKKLAECQFEAMLLDLLV